MLQGLAHRALARPPLVEDLDRGVGPAQDFVGRLQTIEHAGVRVHEGPFIEIQAALPLRGLDQNEAALAFHFEQLQQSEQRDSRNATDRLGIEHPLQLVREQHKIHGLREDRRDAVGLQPVPQVRVDLLAGHDRDRQTDFFFEKLGQQGETIHHGHLEIGEDRVHVLRGEQLERPFPMLGGDDGEPSSAIERAAQGTAYEIVVVYEEKVRHWSQDSGREVGLARVVEREDVGVRKPPRQLDLADKPRGTEGTPHECPCRNKWPSRLYYLLTWYQPPNRQRDIDTCTTEARTTAHLLGTRATRREAGRVAN